VTAVDAELDSWSTAAVCDAAVRSGVPCEPLPGQVLPVAAGMRTRGGLRLVRHTDSVAAVLEAIDAAVPGEVLLIDDGGRRDQACVGDLVALEAQAAGLAGLVVWGSHRDSAELAAIGLPVFSLGPCPFAPRSAPPREPSALPGSHGDLVLADADGVVVLPAATRADVLRAAEQIIRTERAQAAALRRGRSLRSQLEWADFLVRRAEDPAYTFRTHLTTFGGKVE